MKLERIMVTLVLLDVVLSMSTIGVEIGFSWLLPNDLQEYVWGGFSPDGMRGLAVASTWALSVLGTITAWVGLCFYWRYARELYAVSWALNLLVGLPAGVSVMTSAGAIVQTMSSIVGGMLLAVVYFTDLRTRFESRPHAPALGLVGTLTNG